MIVHVVLFRPKPDLDPESRDELIRAFRETLSAVGAIKRARIGRRVTLGRAYEQLMPEDFPYAAVLEFADVAGIEAYLEHPAHERLAREFFTCCEHALMYDFDLDEGERVVETLA